MNTPMKLLEGKTLSLKIWWGATSGDDWDIKSGFTRSTEHEVNTLRIGQLVIAFGVENFG